MTAKQVPVDSSPDGIQELDRLEQLRLSRDWSYRQLADDMRRVGFEIPDKTLQSLLSRRPKPYDRTLYKIRKYFEQLDAETRRKRA